MDPIEQALQRTMVLKCQVGDRQALAELFLRHNRRLAYYLRRMLGRDDIEDVQQDVWVTVIRKIGRLRQPESFVVWLYQIARRKALNRLADRHRMVSLDVHDPPDASAMEADAEFSAADAELIHQNLATLGPEHREVLVLRFMEDLSYEQIAQVTGCNVGTVRSRLHYAKQSLRMLLEQKP